MAVAADLRGSYLIRLPFRVLFDQGAVLFWGAKKGPNSPYIYIYIYTHMYVSWMYIRTPVG